MYGYTHILHDTQSFMKIFEHRYMHTNTMQLKGLNCSQGQGPLIP